MKGFDRIMMMQTVRCCISLHKILRLPLNLPAYSRESMVNSKINNICIYVSLQIKYSATIASRLSTLFSPPKHKLDQNSST